MAFTLPDLPYPHDALEPVIDARTMEIHHGKHHAGYVANLNAALEGTEHDGTGLEEILSNLSAIDESIRTAVRNNAGGHFNHSLFWSVMCPTADCDGPEGEMAEAIDASFGSLDSLKEQFGAQAAGRFGSGWAWLCAKGDGLFVCSTPNQDNPLMGDCGCCCEGAVPILGCDVWEHAYYLGYQNRRPDYVAAWWDVVNWRAVARNLATAVGSTAGSSC